MLKCLTPNLELVFRHYLEDELKIAETMITLPRSKRGFVLSDLPFKTIWGINTVHSYFTIQNHNSEWFQMVHQLV